LRGWGRRGLEGGRPADDAAIEEFDGWCLGGEERGDGAGGAGRDGVQVDIVERAGLGCGESGEGIGDAPCRCEGVAWRDNGEDVVCGGDEGGVRGKRVDGCSGHARVRVFASAFKIRHNSIIFGN